MSGFVDKLREERERLLNKYQMKTTEVAIDNFVFNHEGNIEAILCGDFEERYEMLGGLSNYISEEFGYVEPLSLDKKELLWLVAREVEYHRSSPHGVDAYDEEPFDSVDLDSLGEWPVQWEEGYPLYNRNS